MIRFIVAVVAGLACGSVAATARYNWPSPAQNFSACYYQSPGGIGRGRVVPGVYGGADVTTAKEVPHPQSCGSGRKWDGRRCVDARPARPGK
jgi:hypothetical protein